MKIEIEINDKEIAIIANTLEDQGFGNTSSIDIQEAIKNYIQAAVEDSRWERVDCIVDAFLND